MVIYLSHSQSFISSSKINGKGNKPTPPKLSSPKDPVSMRLVCLGCELENNKPELCSFSRAKMKKPCTTKNERSHDSVHFPGPAPGWLLITEVVKEAQQLSSCKQTDHMSQHRHLPASSPSAFLNQHHSKFPKFPISECHRSQHTAQNVTVRKGPLE